MAILAKTITPTGVELNYHRIGEYLETDEKITLNVYSYLTEENRHDYQPTFRTQMEIPKYPSLSDLTENNVNHLNYAYAMVYDTMVDGSFYLKIKGDVVNDEPVSEYFDALLHEVQDDEIDGIEPDGEE
jgi:hypothetical protein